jgi:hypothetical protein
VSRRRQEAPIDKGEMTTQKNLTRVVSRTCAKLLALPCLHAAGLKGPNQDAMVVQLFGRCAMAYGQLPFFLLVLTTQL